MTDWVACPHCGERIARNAKACRHCGSDERTGWSEDTYLDGVDLPDSPGEDGEEDYADGLEREGFGRRKPDLRTRIVGAVAGILILLFALWLLRGVF